MVVEVPARCVIGVDLGGTKLLAGAVDPARLTVHHRARREAFGLDQPALIEAVVEVDNDANCAVWAETRAGAARGAADVAMLTIGTGIGVGLVLGGRLYRG